MSTTPPAWSTRAVNLAEHADNPVHTIEGGIAAGYTGAVVAGTTVYAYLTRPAVEAWGTDWIERGTGEVRFRRPVLADERVDVVPVETDGSWVLEARAPSGLCATLGIGIGTGDAPDPVGERLEPLVVELDDRWAGYGRRAGDDLSFYDDTGLLHPVVWPSLANRIFSTQLVAGAWVHTRSKIRHLAAARPGDIVVVEGWLVDRFETRAGERAVVDVRVTVDDRPVVAMEHEALVRLAPNRGDTE